MKPGDLVVREKYGAMPIVLVTVPSQVPITVSSPVISISEGEVALVISVSTRFGTNTTVCMHVLYEGAVWFTNSSFWKLAP